MKLRDLASFFYRLIPMRIHPIPKDLDRRNDDSVRRIARRNSEGSVFPKLKLENLGVDDE